MNAFQGYIWWQNKCVCFWINLMKCFLQIIIFYSSNLIILLTRLLWIDFIQLSLFNNSIIRYHTVSPCCLQWKYTYIRLLLYKLYISFLNHFSHFLQKLRYFKARIKILSRSVYYAVFLLHVLLPSC